MGDLRTLAGFAAIVFLVEVAIATNFTVGGPNGGWDQSTSLQSWASSQTFTVGDNLIFQYTPMHDVLEVTKADYSSCQASSPLQSYNDGNTVVPLASPGKRYFICGTTGHCTGGMKLLIDTVAPSAPPTSPSTPLSPSPKSPPPSEAPSPKSSPSTKAPSPSPKKASPSAPPSGSPTKAPSPKSHPRKAPSHSSKKISPSASPSGAPASPTKVAGPASSGANVLYFSNEVILALGFGLLVVLGF